MATSTTPGVPRYLGLAGGVEIGHAHQPLKIVSSALSRASKSLPLPFSLPLTQQNPRLGSCTLPIIARLLESPLLPTNPHHTGALSDALRQHQKCKGVLPLPCISTWGKTSTFTIHKKRAKKYTTYEAIQVIKQSHYRNLRCGKLVVHTGSKCNPACNNMIYDQICANVTMCARENYTRTLKVISKRYTTFSSEYKLGMFPKLSACFFLQILEF